MLESEKDGKILELYEIIQANQNKFFIYCEELRESKKELSLKIVKLKAELSINEGVRKLVLEIAEKNAKTIFQLNHAGFLKRLKYLFTGRF